MSSISFNKKDLKSSGFLTLLPEWFLDEFTQIAFRVLRRFCPILKFGKWAVLTRYDDVQDALVKQDVFTVPFGPKMKALNGGPNFLLGMQDGVDYQCQRKFVMQTFQLEDIPSTIVPLTVRLSQHAIAKSDGRLDAVRDLITFVPTEICEQYFGVSMSPQDKANFALWTIAMSTYTFADFGKNKRVRKAALTAARQTRRVVDSAIQSMHGAALGGNNILARLKTIQQAGNGFPTNDEICSILMGMITGFVPTNTMAAGNILEMLLRKPHFMAKSQAAAMADDDRLLSRCLFEAMRFKPLNPGPIRLCIANYNFHKTGIRKGTTVLVSTQSAMFDSRRVKHPQRFDPERPPSDYLLFGHGLHWCVGAFLADAQITQMFKPLLKKPRLRRASGPAGELRRIGPFPEHLVVEF